MPNHLSDETSPYLLQHADNPVDWHAWGDTALELARSSEKPILLSVGYSACHWCHVMAHECFEDEATAALMNRLFINIKVDREERPDIDKIYQQAHQLISQSPGGWPLTVFLTPEEHLPIFSGTYFPREMFKQVLERVDSFFRSHQDQVFEHGEALKRAFDCLTLSIDTQEPELESAPLKSGRTRLAEIFDAEHGGFGGAPKFPHPTHIETLLDQWRATAETAQPDLDGLYMATLTLTRMADGGLYDQIGGGFFRYTVDGQWTIPHFEKMLYDNSALLSVYVDAYAATGEETFARVASETADWVLRDMQDSEGAFYATLDADSEGVEGRFYLWTPDELAEILDNDENAIASERFGLTESPNFEGNAWHLVAAKPLESLTRSGSLDETMSTLDRARARMLEARSQRVWPGRDEKILVAWNGLMIGALAKTGRVLQRDYLTDAADGACKFIHKTLWSEGRLRAVYAKNRAQYPAYLDDYAFLAHGILELLQTRWRTADLIFAIDLVETLLAQFEDRDGGFFFTAHDHEPLIHRPKPFADEATPSGNGIAAQVLLALGHLLGEPRYIGAAERTLKAAWPALRDYPHAHGSLLRALSAMLEAYETVILRGPATEIGDWQKFLNAGFNPHRTIFAIDDTQTDFPGLLAERRTQGGPIAYVCRGTTCGAPIDTLEALTAELGTATRPA
ncbi:MAG: thioredoxin domain-containing protein [Gammaproteobacteria bacterium]|nr:thioredoxin domain-containing protein [Gammaproteobacteria bacterium]